MAEIKWDDDALAEYLAGVSMAIVRELVPQVQEVAQVLAPVRVRHTWPRHPRQRSHPKGTGGRLKASVHAEYGADDMGPYGDVAALWYGRFLDPRARQLHRLYPFLPTALYSVCQGRVLHFG